MTKYWTYSKTYTQLTAEQLQKKARESVEKSAKKGKHLEPVIATGRNLVQSWWGQAWCNNIEQYADYSSRLARGKHYIRSGALIDLKIEGGRISAKVQGNRRTPYKVEIKIGRLSEERCQEIIDVCGKKIQSLEQLLNGQFPDELKDVFLDKNGLFPKPSEISYSCSCPDWAIMCKHVAAVLYGVGVRFDDNPFLFFELRGIDINRFIDVTIQSKVESMLANIDNKTKRMIDDNQINKIFGF